MSSVSRRPARIFAMQLIYAMDLTASPAGVCLPGVLASAPIQDDMKKYGMSLVDLYQEHRSTLEKEIKSLSHAWDLGRMATLDRILIMIAMVELLYKPDIPTKVAILEAVQIANKFSTDDSPQFVNGILNQFAKNKGMLSEKKSGDQN
ncbi:MAG: transcription antitermination factor NusB [Fibrobacter sp.]|jgi:N utilization substance protein B|nr:transcription antitermination factor NusB [Fibrobacter sp.]